MAFKDLFSSHAEDYKKYRPIYPEALFSYLAQLAPNHKAAWDCGTGNGQGAVGLSPFFEKIFATDGSASQIQQAEPSETIVYQVATAENSKLKDNSISLVTVFQALHWFQLDKFYQEVKRVTKPKGILAIIGYHTALTGIEAIDKVYRDFCFDYLWQKNCWAMERPATDTILLPRLKTAPVQQKQ